MNDPKELEPSIRTLSVHFAFAVMCAMGGIVTGESPVSARDRGMKIMVSILGLCTIYKNQCDKNPFAIVHHAIADNTAESTADYCVAMLLDCWVEDCTALPKEMLEPHDGA
jgi:hypothetical protein